MVHMVDQEQRRGCTTTSRDIYFVKMYPKFLLLLPERTSNGERSGDVPQI
jgi:hypothetical protein